MSDSPYLSRDARARLEAEVAALRAERAGLADDLAAARAQTTNLAENAGYEAVLEEVRRVETRIDALEELLVLSTDVRVVTDGTVTEGATVTLAWPDGSRTTMFVGLAESAPDGMDTVTVGSPLGKALLGAKEGAVVVYRSPGGERRVEIVTVA